MVALPGAATRPSKARGAVLLEPPRTRREDVRWDGDPDVAVPAGAAPRWRRALGEFAWLGAVGVSAFAVVLAFGLLASEPGVRPVPAATAVVPVGVHDSLPEIAARFAPGSDQEAVVRRIVELNRLDAARPAESGELVVPVQRG